MAMHIENPCTHSAEECMESFNHFLNTKNRKELKKATRPRIGWSRIPTFVPERLSYDMEWHEHPEYGWVEVKVYKGVRAHVPSLV